MAIIAMRMAMSMKVISREGKCMVVDLISLLMRMNIMVNGKMIRWKEKVYILQLMGIIMREYSRMGN